MTNQATQTQGITDQEYLELAEHAKSIVDLSQLETKKLKEENMELKKTVITAYSFIRVIDDQFDLVIPPEASYALEMVRTFLSEFIENKIF